MATLTGLVLPASGVSAEMRPMEPLVCGQIGNSQSMIQLAARGLGPGRVSVMGASSCFEIPLRHLVDQFEHVGLHDLDRESLEVALRSVSPAQGRKVTARVADVTGFAEPYLEQIDACLARAETPASAIADLTALTRGGSVDVTAAALPASDLVVCSCVLSQLHIAAQDKVQARFAARFPEVGAAPLRESQAWVEATLALVHDLQRAFLRDLRRMVAPSGRLYLSASVQVGQVWESRDGAWATPGWYRLISEPRLSDCLEPGWDVLLEARWPWVVTPPEPGGAPGLVNHVNALILAPRGTAPPDRAPDA